MIVNTITMVLNVIKLGQLLQCLCSYATNSPQYTRKDIVLKHAGKWSGLQCSCKLNIGCMKYTQ